VIIYPLVGLNDISGRMGWYFLILFLGLEVAENLMTLISAIVII